MRLVASDVSKVVDSLTKVKRYFVGISNKGSQRHNSRKIGGKPAFDQLIAREDDRIPVHD